MTIKSYKKLDERLWKSMAILKSKKDKYQVLKNEEEVMGNNLVKKSGVRFT